MSQTAVDASYREAASTLAPQAVSEYLALSSWDLERHDEIKEIWRLVGPEGKAIGRLMLPLATDYCDFQDRFYDALTAIGRINGWDADKLLEQILATRADLFFVRLDQSTIDGTIPIKQAESTIDAIYKMLRSAATATAETRGLKRGQLPAVVSNFLEEDVRLGHTKRGSFVFTVAARFSNGIEAGQSLQDIDAQPPEHRAFSRRVMETLAWDLELARDITSEAEQDALPADFRPMSAGILESLEDMAKPEGLRSLELSFQWAMAIPRPGVGAEPIKLEHGAVASLSRMRERLLPLPVMEQSRRETLVGTVQSLAREDSEEEDGETGEVVLLADVNGKKKHVHVVLAGRDHDWAIQFYRSKRPMAISGNLVFERQRWRLVGEVEVDANFL